jgi:outer membrane receptor protein involved in Fe transport
VISSYTATDFTGNWRVRDDLRLSLGIRNAFDDRHAEYQGFSTISEIPRSAFIALTYQPR